MPACSVAPKAIKAAIVMDVLSALPVFSKLTNIKEHPGKYESSKDMLKELLKDHETVIIALRKNIVECADKNNDAGTADYLTGLMEQHETMSWILRRYLN